MIPTFTFYTITLLIINLNLKLNDYIHQSAVQLILDLIL